MDYQSIFKSSINLKVDRLNSTDLEYFSISGPFSVGYFAKGKVKGLLKFKRDNTVIEKEFWGKSIPEVLSNMIEFLNE